MLIICNHSYASVIPQLKHSREHAGMMFNIEPDDGTGRAVYRAAMMPQFLRAVSSACPVFVLLTNVIAIKRACLFLGSLVVND